MRWLLFITLGAFACGCAGPTRGVTLQVSAAGKPLAGAQVRAIAIDAGLVPVPLNPENFEEYTTAYPALAVTDERGIVRITLHKNSPHAVEVIAPALGELGGRGPWMWTLGLDGATLARSEAGAEAGSAEVGLAVVP